MQEHRLLDSEHSKELFSYYGLAVYYSQALEQQLVNLLVLMKLTQGKVSPEEELTSLYYKKLGNSLGQLVNEIQHNFAFTEEESTLLNNIWKKRNYIVHDYFKERILETFSSEGRSQMIEELIEFKDQAQNLEQKLLYYTKELLNSLELEEEEIGQDSSDEEWSAQE
ncbi:MULTISPECIES: hypothetical protein [unclassified Paenibacillus]|uniref:Uncharacterized protein n=1 Tax=Paenibacillus provencensis TaxID=441151 RepID=A0ABW3PSP6_9BACL|nr:MULTISPECIES: hypothetical protein [unclassified Paenibacillus]MCM3128812.1 hypothetical protein [Paenibacillus sp. MER 78]SFS48892.1 hypothetical protein SAMN04488601_1011063 [Paenibacillus sp. 453mf]